MPAEVFVSYARKDRDQVLPWIHQLQAAGVSVWLDEQDIDGAHLWTEEITQAIRACRVLALLLSPASAASEQVLREVTLALEEHKAILPLLLEPVEIPATLRYPLAGLQQIELFRGDPEAKRTAVLRALTRLGVAAPAWQTTGLASPSESGIGAGSRAGPHPRHNLPQSLTRFIGREREIAAVREQLTGSRLLTLTGIGGLGKTRLALEVAREVAGDFLDGVWLVELAALSEPGLVPQQVATALGIREEPGRSLIETLTDYLQPRQVLLVLDNAEHLVGGCADMAQALLQACPDLRLLVTSREALGVAGEHVLRLPALGAPVPPPPPVEQLTQYEAVRLFVERAVLAQPTFVVTNANAPAVAAVCHRLDGIPLALELAASQVKLLSMEQLLARLEDRFRLLTGGSRTVLPRQQTLRAAMDWSYDLLSEPERVLLRRLSVFAGGFALEAAEAICTGEGIEAGSVTVLLGHLVDKSLVQVEEQSGVRRYRLLETIRAYGWEKLSGSAEETWLRLRHRDWYRVLADQAASRLHGPEQAESLERLEREHDNLRTALDWSVQQGQAARLPRLSARLSRARWLTGSQKAVLGWMAVRGEVAAALQLGAALWPFWLIRGHLAEGRESLRKLLELVGWGPPRRDAPEAVRSPDPHSHTLSRVWHSFWPLGGWALAKVELAVFFVGYCIIHALAEHRESRLWAVLSVPGVCLLATAPPALLVTSMALKSQRKRRPHSRPVSRGAIARATILVSLLAWIFVWWLPWLIFHVSGWMVFALLLTLALVILEMAREWPTSGRAKVLNWVAGRTRFLGPRTYTVWFLAAPRIWLMEILLAGVLACFLLFLTFLYRHGGPVAAFLQWPITVTFLLSMGFFLGLLPIAFDELLAKLVARSGKRRLAVLARVLHGAGELAEAQAEIEVARRFYERSLTLYRQLGNVPKMATLLDAVAHIAEDQGDLGAARALYEMNLAIWRKRSDRSGVATALHHLATIAYHQEEYEAARVLLQKSLALWHEQCDPRGMAAALFRLGQVTYLCGELSKAQVPLAESLILRRQLGDRRGLAECLEGIAGLAGKQGQPERAARLFGAAEALREAIGAPLRPSERAGYDRHVADVRAALDEAAEKGAERQRRGPDPGFASAWAEGRALSLEQAISLALEPPGTDAPTSPAT